MSLMYCILRYNMAVITRSLITPPSTSPALGLYPNEIPEDPPDITNQDSSSSCGAPQNQESIMREIPPEHRDLVNFGEYDLVRRVVKGDGGCFYRSLQVLLDGSEEGWQHLRRDVHQYIISNFDFFSNFAEWPLQIRQVVAGKVEKQTISKEEYTPFLESQGSLYSYTDSDLDVNAAAHFLGREIQVYSTAFGWSVHSPGNGKRITQSRGKRADGRPLRVYLQDDVHFDALVDRDGFEPSSAEFQGARVDQGYTNIPIREEKGRG